MISIVLCDDHEIVRKGLRQLLQEQPGFLVLADVASGEELLKELRNTQPDVVLLDLALPGRSGLEVLKQLRLLQPEIKVLVLSMYPEDQFALRVIKAGAQGYLHKDSPPQQLTEAVRAVAEGKKYVSPHMVEILFNEVALKNNNQPLHAALSDREMEVLLLLAEGKKLSEIAGALSLSVKTVSTYKMRIFEKLRLKSLTAISRYVTEHGLVKNVEG
ncbi:MAG TPA: response regulator transcription factor [Chitinophagales bacterium]|nr:response regulator transcription factor [Chitinophagales bacterium]